MSLEKIFLRTEFPGDFSLNINAVHFGENALPFLIKTKSEETTKLNPLVISTFETKVKMHLVEEEMEGNVCFANREEVRADFRTVFTLQELLEYIFALFPPVSEKKPGKILLAYPTDAEHFWELVHLGQKKILGRKE